MAAAIATYDATVVNAKLAAKQQHDATTTLWSITNDAIIDAIAITNAIVTYAVVTHAIITYE